MKGGKEHSVPLSGRAVDILNRMDTFRSTPGTEAYVFEGQKQGRPLSDMTLTMPIRRAGLPITVHGFRSAFRDWCAEATATPREVAEACLAHVVRNAVEAAYARTDHLDKRRIVMDDWAAYCAGTSPSSNVVPIQGAR